MPDEPKVPRASTNNALVHGNPARSIFGEAAFGEGGFGEGGFGGAGLNQSYFTPDFNEDFEHAPAPPTGVIETVGNADGLSQVQAVGVAAQTIELRHNELLHRLTNLEKALARIEKVATLKVKTTSRIGHNNPPEAIEVPVTPRRRRKIEAAIKIIAKEPSRPKRNPKGAIRAAQWLKAQGKRLLKWCRTIITAFATTAALAAAKVSGEEWGTDIHDASLKAARALGECLVHVGQAAQEWANALHLFL